MATQELRAALRKPFPVSEVQQRQGPGGKKLDYVAIETVLARLLDETAKEPSGYAWQVTGMHVEKVDDQWSVVVAGNLMIAGDMGGGIGAMTNRDLDMAAKSANSEAIKNAAKNGFGVALELWNAEYRDSLSQKRRLAGGSEQALKSEVWNLAKERLGVAKPDPSAIADLFSVSAGDLADPAVLKSILEGEGYEFTA